MSLLLKPILRFEKEMLCDFARETKQYIVLMKVSSTSLNYICLFDKNMNFIREFSCKLYPIDRVLTNQNDDLLIMVSSQDNPVIIIDLETEKQKEIPLTDYSDQEDENRIYPSMLYEWKKDICFIHTIFNKIYRLDTTYLLSSIITLEELKNNVPDFYYFLQKTFNYTIIKNVIEQNHLFTYQHDQTIGLVNMKDKSEYTASYSNTDAHEIFFYHNAFIVITCHSIEWVTKTDTKVLYTFAKESHREFRKAFFSYSTGCLLIFDRYWDKSTLYYTVSQFCLAEHFLT